jgi:hypothetical protein
MGVLGLVLGAGVAHAGSQDETGSPDWLEARGVSLVNLVGQLPEEVLRGAILAYGDNAGIAVYEAGTRLGETVVITATLYPRIYEGDWAPNNQYSQFGCLGQKPIFDHMGTVVPASILRVYTAAGIEVTSEIWYLYVTSMGLSQPLAGSPYWDRYPVDLYGPWQPNPLPLEPDGLHIPANSGCQIQIPGADYYPLTGVFTVHDVPAVEASVVAIQEAIFRSYIGPGGFGIFAPLMQQLRDRYPDRHGRIALDAPAGASHFLSKFPPAPADPWADQSQPGYRNATRLTGGTYRLSGSFFLSTDMTFSAAFPLDVAWRDQDQAPGCEFLPLLGARTALAPPEYVIPVGVAYDDCFTGGDCPQEVLEAIYDAVMEMEVFYLSVAPPAAPGRWVALNMTGPDWSPRGAVSARAGDGVPPQPSWQGPAGEHALFFPYIASTAPRPPSGDCPCGWFDDQGQMLDYFVAPEP